GLLGHLHSMALASGVSAVVNSGAVPVLESVRDLIDAGIVPGGTRTNEGYIEQFVDWADGVDKTTRTLLADAQTSGGLLIAVAEDQADTLVQRLQDAGTLAAARVGRFVE